MELSLNIEYELMSAVKIVSELYDSKNKNEVHEKISNE